MATHALAQSSVGVPTSAATAHSLADAVAKNENDLIDREVLGRTGTGIGGPGVFATGRIRASEHEGVRPRGTATYAYETDEASAFANFVATLPGTVVGGQVKVAGFVGHNWLALDLKSNATAVLDPNQFGSSENDSLIAGITALWALNSTYALATIVGTWGETRLLDSVDDCGHPSPPHPTGCNANRYRFDTTGFIGTVTAGHVFDLAGVSGPKLDVRGSAGYTYNSSGTYTNVFDFEQRYKFSTWTGSVAATLFANVALQNSALFRPYVQAYLRQEWAYDNAIAFVHTSGAPSGVTHFHQKHLYGGVDAGATYTLDKMTLGAAVYYEASGDESTLGARIGASWKLN
jgi:hypothetical protein